MRQVLTNWFAARRAPRRRLMALLLLLLPLHGLSCAFAAGQQSRHKAQSPPSSLPCHRQAVDGPGSDGVVLPQSGGEGHCGEAMPCDCQGTVAQSAATQSLADPQWLAAAPLAPASLAVLTPASPLPAGRVLVDPSPPDTPDRARLSIWRI